MKYNSDLTICPSWGAGEADPKEAVTSNIPTLVLAGEYDPVTPPAWGEEAAQSFLNSFYLEFPGTGHGVTFQSCGEEVALDFLEAPSLEPSADCVVAMTGPDFATSWPSGMAGLSAARKQGCPFHR